MSLFASVLNCYDNTKEDKQMWSSDIILNELRDFRQVCARKVIIEATIQQLLDQQPDSPVPSTLKALLHKCETMERRVMGWLSLLTTEERFIVQTHLVDGLDWARTVVEHEQKWGAINGRSERTLKRIQSKAIQRILNCLTQLENMNEN